MKKIIFTVSVFVFIFFKYCSDEVDITKKDLYKYPWLYPFINNHNLYLINGIRNIDTEKMILNFKYERDVSIIEFHNYDSIAKVNNWEILNKNKTHLKFKKDISKIIGLNNSIIYMRIEEDTLNNIITFKIK